MLANPLFRPSAELSHDLPYQQPMRTPIETNNAAETSDVEEEPFYTEIQETGMKKKTPVENDQYMEMSDEYIAMN